MVLAGSIIHPEGEQRIAPSTSAEIDSAVDDLVGTKQQWASLALEDRIFHLERVMANTLDVAEEWVRAACDAKALDFDTPVAGEEWSSGPMLTIRNARLLRDSLRALANGHKPSPPHVTTRPDGQTVAQVFPTDGYDRALWQGLTAEVWMRPGVTPGNLAATQATAYDRVDHPGGVRLVLGAGNIASIPTMDTLWALFAKREVVLLKLSPVNEYLGPYLAESFASLIEAGFVRLIYGGVTEGSYAAQHPGVDSIHVTGSDKTYQALRSGSDVDPAGRGPVSKPITAELGNVTPVIVVPGPWKSTDLEFQGKNLAGMIAHNAGFNCITPRVLVTHLHWQHREGLLAALAEGLARTPTRDAYYPGAADRVDMFLDAHPEAQAYGEGSGPQWQLITGLDPDRARDVCYRVEAFAGLAAEAALDAPRSVPDFLEQAVAFCNHTLWGSLGASLIVHPETLRDAAASAAIEKAIADLRYGTVAVNAWSGIGYLLTSTTWGPYPGHQPDDIQSGVGVTHNTYLFDEHEKSVIRAPFRSVLKPLWFADHRQAHTVTRYLTEFEADPKPWKLAPIVAAALRG